MLQGMKGVSYKQVLLLGPQNQIWIPPLKRDKYYCINIRTYNYLFFFNVSGENSVNRGTAENGIPGSTTNNTNTGKANYQRLRLS